jgi:uncharacterized protein YukE
MSTAGEAHRKIQKTLEDVQKFQDQSFSLRTQTLPGMYESFGIDDIWTLGTIEIVKKQLNDSLSDTIHVIENNDGSVNTLKDKLHTYDQDIDPMLLLGDLVKYFGNIAVLIATVHCFNAPDLSIRLDTKLQEIADIIVNVGDVVSLALLFEFPEISIAITILLGFFSGIVSFVEITEKKDKVDDLRNRLNDTYGKIRSNTTDVEQKVNQIADLFAKLKNYLSGLGHKWDSNTRYQDIASEYVLMQTELQHTYEEYQGIKSLLTDPNLRNDIAKSLGENIGYGNISRATFFMVLYAADFVPTKEVPAFLESHTSLKKPASGWGQLVDAITYIRETFPKQAKPAFAKMAAPLGVVQK